MTTTQEIIIALIVPTFGLSIKAILKRPYRQWRAKKREQYYSKLIAKLERIGPVLAANTVEGVFALCDRHILELARARLKNAFKGNLPDSILIKVIPTYTFAQGYQTMERFQTGRLAHAEEILRELVWQLLGRSCKRDILEGDLLQRLIRVVVKEDPKLYVPFVGSMYLPEWGQYLETTRREAVASLVTRVVDRVKEKRV